MMQDSIFTMIGLYCIILTPFFIAWLFVRRANKKIDEEQEELLRNQKYARCSCGYQELYDKREKTVTECPECGAKAFESQS